MPSYLAGYSNFPYELDTVTFDGPTIASTLPTI